MLNGSAPTLMELELHPSVAPTHATAGARVFTLLPRLETLVGRDGFGTVDPIRLPSAARPFDPWRLWQRAARRVAVH